MREHPLLASALHAFPRPGGHSNSDIDFARRPYGEGDFPSELPFGGRAGWARFTASSDDTVNVSFPADWDQLRADRGWASLQYAALLRTRVTIPSNAGAVLVDALQAVEYAFVADGDDETPPTWYNGDVYAFGATPLGERDTSGPSNFAKPVVLAPGGYTLLVRAIYECRMFGDPGVGNRPVINVTFRAWAGAPTTLLPGLGVFPDAVDGWLAGGWASVPVRAGAKPLVLDFDAEVAPGLRLATVKAVHVEPYQTRPVALQIKQAKPLPADVKQLKLALGSFPWAIDVTHVSIADTKSFRLTFASPAPEPRQPPALVSLAVVAPPSKPYDPPTFPVFLALHGAGVFNEEPGWIGEMPSVPLSWVILPSGRNEWGEDWHGGSMADVWAARDALAPALAPIGVTVSDETVLIGHSNGGQGTWHLAARYPDRIRAAIIAAGYLKIQDYVPYTEHTGWRYADPALAGVLMSALSPYNNDLYASNLASVPILAIHGGADDNVPPRHGRAHVALVSAWTRSGADIKFVEFKGKDHYWPGIFREDVVKEFIASLPPKRSIDEVRKAGFTLATANPDESGGKGGIKIIELLTPGRLARLDVNAPQWKDGAGDGGLDLHGTNIKRIEVTGYTQGEAPTTFELENGEWAPSSAPLPPPRAYGPVIRLLSSRAPIVLVVPEASDSPLRSFAVRYANDLFTYHRVDVNILGDGDALRAVADGSLGSGSVVALGRPDQNRYSHWLIAQERIPRESCSAGLRF